MDGGQLSDQRVKSGAASDGSRDHPWQTAHYAVVMGAREGSSRCHVCGTRAPRLVKGVSMELETSCLTAGQ